MQISNDKILKQHGTSPLRCSTAAFLFLAALMLGFAWAICSDYALYSDLTDTDINVGGDTLIDHYSLTFQKIIQEHTKKINDPDFMERDDDFVASQTNGNNDEPFGINHFKSNPRKKEAQKLNDTDGDDAYNVRDAKIQRNPEFEAGVAEHIRKKFRLNVYSDKNDIPVFYNLDIETKKFVNEETVQQLIGQQFDKLLPVHKPIYVNALGSSNAGSKVVSAFSTTEHPIEIIDYQGFASEISTLKALWDYCSLPENVDRKVAYLNTQSFSGGASGRLRRFMTAGALSQACSTMDKDTCNICSARFSPLPHPHTPGNMWLARCDYIQELANPETFENAMDRLGDRSSPSNAVCYGKADGWAEHWAYSHPRARPCDISTRNYTWGYEGIPKVADLIGNGKLQSAPRFELESFRQVKCSGKGTSQKFRIDEYQALYHEDPPKEWWGYGFLE